MLVFGPLSPFSTACWMHHPYLGRAFPPQLVSFKMLSQPKARPAHTETFLNLIVQMMEIVTRGHQDTSSFWEKAWTQILPGRTRDPGQVAIKG